MTHTLTYRIHEVAPYINWIYFSTPGDSRRALPPSAAYTVAMPVVPVG